MILSVFDGIACGYMALKQAGIEFDKYVAYEIDKYAIQTATHNFPDIIEKGDVFDADFTEYRGQVDYLIGGSPCTYWSIAQKNNRETEASGLGWELFSQYVRALREAEPKYFLYENNKSMSKAIRESITEAFGFEPICINSALVSGQNRQRLYWVGKREADGTYSKVHIEQPEDRGILLKDILETGCGMSDKSHCVISSCARTTTREYFIKNQGDMCAEPVPINTTTEGKASTMMAGHYKYGEATILKNDGFKGGANAVAEPIQTTKSNYLQYDINGRGNNSQDQRIYYPDSKAGTVEVNGGAKYKIVEPICVNSKSGRNGIDGLQPSLQDRIYSIEGKHTACTTAFMPNIAEPVVGYDLESIKPLEDQSDNNNAPIRLGTIASNVKNKEADSQQYRVYSPNGKSVTICGSVGSMGKNTGLYAVPCDEPMRVKEATKKGYTEILPGECVDMTQPNSKTRRGRNMSDKSNCCMTSCQYYQYCAKLNAIPCEWNEDGEPVKAISCADGKTYTVYKVADGQITIKGKTYPIKLVDGFYIIRKLTVRECARLQQIPEWIEFPCSDSQSYKQIGNGWSICVIEHLLRATKE